MKKKKKNLLSVYQTKDIKFICRPYLYIYSFQVIAENSSNQHVIIKFVFFINVAQKFVEMG